MKKVLIFTALIANLFLLNNCSSETNTANNVVDKQVLNANSQNVNVPNVNTQVIENGSVAPVPVVIGNNANLPASNSPMNTNRRRLVNSNSNEKPKTSLLPAPNNSEIGTMMNDKGDFIEVRIFKSEKLLLKTERNVNAQKVTVFLKNGKTIQIPDSKLSNHLTASPQEILIAAGVLQKPDESQTGGK